jgi:MFS superfamily sulfate permease-like transporter
MNFLHTLLPFLRWFPMSINTLRADLVAGVTVALILVPQSMAYAQLAGLPVVYGLYASFIPVIVASLWGSSNQLHTGPVAMLSLMSAAAVMSFATPGTSDFIQLSLMLALMVGVLRLALGVFRLGAIVNLLSSPVIVGFTNAAALIIGLSQLSKVIGVPFPRSESYLADLWGVVEQLAQVHWWTLAFAAGAWLLISGLRRVSPSLPAVLIAVAAATLISAVANYEDKTTISTKQILDTRLVQAISNHTNTQNRITELTEQDANNNQRAQELEQKGGIENIKTAKNLLAQVAINEYELAQLKQTYNKQTIDLHGMTLHSSVDSDGMMLFYHANQIPANVTIDNRTWRISGVSNDKVTLSSGGAVVGAIPQGLPSFEAPVIRWDLLLALFPAALVMALIGFMEATSISKAIATSTGERVNTSKELIGQGLANIAGSFFGSYTVSGSFSRSAVAARSGAKTGLFAIISALAVVSVLLFFTPYLYHLPQAVLAVIVMMAVFSLIRIKPLIHAWSIDRVGAIIGIITFFATLIMAPAIANGILLGIALTILDCLIRTMKPRTEVISRKADGTLGGIRAHRLEPISEHFVPVRFDGSLNFINVAYFEDMILEAHTDFPQAEFILVVGSGINEIDASGEEKIREVAKRLADVGVTLVFSGLKHQVNKIMHKSGLVDDLGQDAFFPDKETALNLLSERLHPPANPSSHDNDMDDNRIQNSKTGTA